MPAASPCAAMPSTSSDPDGPIIARPPRFEAKTAAFSSLPSNRCVEYGLACSPFFSRIPGFLMSGWLNGGDPPQRRKRLVTAAAAEYDSAGCQFFLKQGLEGFRFGT